MITHLNEKLIAVEVPSDATKICIGVHNTSRLYFNIGYLDFVQSQIPLDNFKILGEVDGCIISFDVEPYVEELEAVRYKDYSGNKEWFAMKNNSFRSLLQSKGIDTNKPNVKSIILQKK